MRRAGFITGALLTVLCALPLRAQQPSATVRGTVVDDATKQPVAGAQVGVAGRTALSDANGRYVITGVRAGSDTVRARRIGYAPATMAVTILGNETVVADFAMSAQAVGLAEMVVTGYGQQTAGDITGAVSQVTTEDFNPGLITVPIQLIQGKVAGVQVVDNNEPGGGTTIRIRGATSVNASSDPLYVVDGMPVGTGAGGGLSAGRDPMNFLNPNDIQSVTVLKDASAAAIYGANAANGVVIITTKSGGGGAARGTQVEYSSSYSTSSVTEAASVLNASQFAAAVATYAPSRVSMLGTASTNWLNLITSSAFGHEQNLSVTNSSLGTYYRLSLGYLNQDGILKGTNTERLSLALNYDQRLFANHLDIKANVKGTRTNDQFTPGDVLGNALSMAPTQPVYDPTNTQGYNTGYWDWATAGASASNPIASLNLATDHGTTWRSVGNVQAEYTLPFFPALKANVNLGYDATLANRSTFTPSNLAGQVRQGHGALSLTQQQPGERGARGVPELLGAAQRPAGQHRPDGRLFVHAVALRVPAVLGDEPQQQLPRRQRHPDGRQRQPRQDRRGLQADLVLRAGELQHQRPLPRWRRASAATGRRGSGPATSGACSRRCPLAWRISGESFLRDLRAISRPEAPGVVGEDGQPGVRGLPAVPDVRVQQRAGAVSVRQPVRHHDPPERGGPEHQVGADRLVQRGAGLRLHEPAVQRRD